jgi:L-asparaginase
VPDHRPSLEKNMLETASCVKGNHEPIDPVALSTEGLPIIRLGRGNTEGFVPLHDPFFIGNSNPTATKARLLLVACLMRFGSLPPAADPDHPTPEEAARIRTKVAAYQTVFDTH